MTDRPDNILKTMARPVVQALTSATATALSLLIRRPWSAAVARKVLARKGFHLLEQRYDLPIPDPTECDDYYWATKTELVGLDMNDQHALGLLGGVLPPLAEEFRRVFPIHRDEKRPGFFLINGNYMAVDAHVYYAFIRHLRPRRIIEIGSGNSTLVAAAAALANQRESGRETELIAIEPNPRPDLRAGFDGLTRLIESKVQEVPVDLFRELGANDILFIDSSHALRSGGDVEFEYLEVLPRLAPGVLVHVHDIGLPKPYPREYCQTQRFWNEQFMLQAFLAFNSGYEVVWPGAYMMDSYPEKLLEIYPECTIMQRHFPNSEPSAFWMRVRS